MKTGNGFEWVCDPASGQVRSVKLFGRELLDTKSPAPGELMLNGLPFAMRPAPRAGQASQPMEENARLRGERFVNHFTGAGLVMDRVIGTRPKLLHRSVGVAYNLAREQAELPGYQEKPGWPPPLPAPPACRGGE